MVKWDFIFVTLYKTFIPEPYKPVRIQARNVLYTKPSDKIIKCKNHQWWKFKLGSCNCTHECIGEKCIVISDSEIFRKCSFDTLYDSANKSIDDSEIIANKEIDDSENPDEKASVNEIIIDELDDDELPIFDRFIQKCVEITGSLYTFIIVWIIIVVWIVIGIVQGGPNNWQIIMQDGQSIQTYVWNTFLMRQQLDDTQKFLRVYGRLRSRAAILNKLLYQVKTKVGANEPICDKKLNIESGNDEPTHLNVDELKDDTKINKLTWFEKLSNIMTIVLGSLPAIVVYWIGIFIWIGCGALNTPTGNQPPFTDSNPDYGKFTNQWQMYINTAVALELLITSVFLENLRLRSNKAARGHFEDFILFDSKLELELRRITGYTKDNLPVIVRPVERPGIRKIISFYAGVVGNGLGLVISTSVFIVWLGIGHLLDWNDNWWLIIGTYTGLIGFIDSVVLREVYYSISDYEDKLFGIIVDESQQLLDIAGYEYDIREASKVEYKGKLVNWNLKVSTYINYVCSTASSVVVSVAVVVGLIIMGCVMHWSETAQLIANTPTMIIEGFFLLILIQAHDMADTKRAKIIQQLAESRKKLFKYIEDAEIKNGGCVLIDKKE